MSEQSSSEQRASKYLIQRSVTDSGEPVYTLWRRFECHDWLFGGYVPARKLATNSDRSVLERAIEFLESESA